MPSSREQPRTAKLFMNGRSQAVRLPRDCRFSGSEVRVRKEGAAVVLEPLQGTGWPAGFWQRLERLRRRLDLDSLERPKDGRARPLDFDVDAP